MSVLLRFYTISDTDISEVLQEHIKLEILHYGEILDLSTIDELDEDIKDDVINWKPKVESDILYVEGMFQSIHFLLTSESEPNLGEFPLNFLNGKRIEIGEIGWGPATFYNSDDVKDIAISLDGINPSELERKYNAVIFNQKGIYPRGYTWTSNDIHDLIKKFLEIKVYINAAKSKNLGIYRVFE